MTVEDALTLILGAVALGIGLIAMWIVVMIMCVIVTLALAVLVAMAVFSAILHMCGVDIGSYIDSRFPTD